MDCAYGLRRVVVLHAATVVQSLTIRASFRRWPPTCCELGFSVVHLVRCSRLRPGLLMPALTHQRSPMGQYTSIGPGVGSFQCWKRNRHRRRPPARSNYHLL